MDPTTTCGPNMACPAKGHTGRGNMGLHARQEKRFLCTECHQTCTATKGTACSRVRTSVETVTLVVTLLAHECTPYGKRGFDAQLVRCGADRGGPRLLDPQCQGPYSVRQGTADCGVCVPEPHDTMAMRALAEDHALRGTGRLVEVDQETVWGWLGAPAHPSSSTRSRRL